jgi:hypothetical protein
MEELVELEGTANLVGKAAKVGMAAMRRGVIVPPYVYPSNLLPHSFNFWDTDVVIEWWRWWTRRKVRTDNLLLRCI